MVRRAKGLMVIWRHWRGVEMLASFDDHILAISGLTRADRHDVLAGPAGATRRRCWIFAEANVCWRVCLSDTTAKR
jgi:hypothetical protein